jgi:hypothetical protein
MKRILRGLAFAMITTSLILISSEDAEAQRRRGGGGASFFSGDSSIGFGLALVPASQNSLDGIIDAYNDANGTSTKNFGSGYEFFANWIYRYERSDYALVFRPSYFMQDATGDGNSLKLSGFTVYPMFRLYALENDFISFFFQAGLGYGSLKGDTKLGSESFSFEGSAFGASGGIGVDFCFVPGHCLTIEGNLRYHPIERNLVKSGVCTISGLQCTANEEFERGNRDVGTSLSGIQGIASYTMKF